MNNVHQFPTKEPVKIVEPLKCTGVGRDKECPNSIQIYTNREPTEDEMHAIHESIRDTIHYAWLSTLKEEGE